MTIAIEIKAWRLSLGREEVLRFADDGFTSRPSDTPANAFFEPRVAAPPRLARVMFDRAATYGATRATPGEIVLDNADGALDLLMADYAFDGRPFSVRVGALGSAVAAWPVVLCGLLDDVKADGGEIRLVVRDRLAALAKTFERPKYAGSNVLPDGLEGTKDDLKDQYKPRVYGGVLNVSAKCVNTSKLIYQVSDQACTVSAAYDNGVTLTRGADYVSQADLLATAPAAGAVRCWSGYFRLGSPPAGQVTADAATPERRVAQLLQALALDAGVPAADILASDVAALGAANPAPAGFWVDGDVTPQAVMDLLAGSVGAWYGFDRLNRLRMGRLLAPAGTPTVIPWDASMAIAVRSGGVPSWRCVVSYARNWTAQAQPAGSVGEARKAFLAQEFRKAAAERAVRTAWPSSEEVTFETCLLNEADAVAEAGRLADLYSVRRMQVDLDLPLAELGALDLDAVVRVDAPRYGLATRLMRVIGLDAGADRDTAKLTLWG